MGDPKANNVWVEALGSALLRGGAALENVPGLLKRILREEAWREFQPKIGPVVRHERFADFVTTPPVQGLGASVELVRRIVADDVEALDLLDRALQGKHGGDRKSDRIKRDNVTVDRDPNQRGSSADYALRRLRKDAPELHAEVLAGKLSAHAAMVKAGFRPRTFTVRADNPERIAATLRRQLDPDTLTTVVRLLQEGE